MMCLDSQAAAAGRQLVGLDMIERPVFHSQDQNLEMLNYNDFRARKTGTVNWHNTHHDSMPVRVWHAVSAFSTTRHRITLGALTVCTYLGM